MPDRSEFAVRRYAVSDVHGYLAEFVAELRVNKLMDGDNRWLGGSAELWCLGDYLDRGEQGLATIDRIRELQRDAATAGGAVHALLGNHEVQFLAARHFGDAPMSTESDVSFVDHWRRYGGRDRELDAVTDDQLEWITALPLIAVSASDVLVHADTAAYLELGATVDDINAAGRAVLESRNIGDWAALLNVLSSRGEFAVQDNRSVVLSAFSAERIVHGHSTLMGGFGLTHADSRTPYRYGGGSVLAIDGGVFEDGGRLLVASLQGEGAPFEGSGGH